MHFDDIEQETTPAPRIARRTVLTGAAWSIPVIAVAVAAPASAASTNAAVLHINTDCLIGALGVNVGFGFAVSNTGTVAYPDGVSVTETVVLSGPLARSVTLRTLVWTILTVQGALGAGTSGVTRGAWSTPVTAGSGNNVTSTSSRSVNISGPITAGSKRSWGYLLGALTTPGLGSLLGNISHTATITSPTGNPPVATAAASVSWSLVSTTCGS